MKQKGENNMQKIENTIIKESAYTEVLENGLAVILIPKKTSSKKYLIWGTHFGSIDNHFLLPGTHEEIRIPDGVAHFLEHKMFEQESGKDSLATLMALGADANAYTTNDHTAYLFECTENFEEALTELMDYVQHPYFTDQNVAKEQGIIGQEITMYDDEIAWQLYMAALDCLYENNPVKRDIAGSIESISGITKETLYNCYNTFYHPSNMTLVACGNFEPEELLNTIKSKLLPKEKQEEIQRIYPEEPEKIHKAYNQIHMPSSIPMFMIGFKDKYQPDQVKKHIAIEILLNILIGKSSCLYNQLYEQGLLQSEPDLDYEFSKQYAHVLISGQSKDPQAIQKALLQTIQTYIQNGLDAQEFERIKKKIYGDYVVEYNEVGSIARMFLADKMKGINSFDYLEQHKEVTKTFAETILKEVFDPQKCILSVVKEEAQS